MKCKRKTHIIIQNRKPQRDESDADDDDSLSSLSFSEEEEITASWRELTGAFLIQLTVSSIGFSYGTISAFSGEGDEFSVNKSFLISSVYITCWAFADPWCRKSFSGKHAYSRILTALGLLISVGGIACNSAMQNIFLQVLGFGLLTGLGTSLVLTQTEELLKFHYPAQHGLVMTFHHVGKALGSSSIPLATCGLFIYYGYQGGSLILASIMMHGLIGIALLFPARAVINLKSKYQRKPRAYTLMNNEELWSNNSHCSSMSQIRNWRNPCRDDLNSSSRQNSGFNGKIENFKSPTSRQRQPPFIEVMPKILEENEEIDEQHVECTSIKQDSCIVHIEHQTVSSTCETETLPLLETIIRTQKSNIQEISSMQEVHTSNNSVELMASFDSGQYFKEHTYEEDTNENNIFAAEDSIPIREHFDASSNYEEITLETSESQTPLTRDSFNDEPIINRRSKSQENSSANTTEFHGTFLDCSVVAKWLYSCQKQPHKAQRDSSCMLKAGPRMTIDAHVNALKTPCFWPVLLLTWSLKLCPILFASLIPSLSLMRVPNCTIEAATFGVSVAGFAWLCLLVLTPWFNSIAPKKRRYVLSGGSFLAAIGLYLLSGADSRDSVTLGCAVFGIGHGIAMNTASTLINETLGSWNLSNITTTLSILSGSLNLISSILLYLILASPGGLRYCFIMLAIIQAVPGIAWLSQPAIKKINICFFS